MKKLEIFLVLAVFFLRLNTTQASIYETFESYDPNSWPEIWEPDANVNIDRTNNKIAQDPSNPNNQVLKMHGALATCYGAHCYHPCTFVEEYILEARIYNGSDSLSGCHPDRAQIGMRQGTSWMNPHFYLLFSPGDGRFVASDGTELMTYQTEQWYDIKILYSRNNTNLNLKYWINGEYKATVYHTISDLNEHLSLDHLELSVGEGSVYFDDVFLSAGNVQEDLLIWPLWEGRTWTYHCQDSNDTAWIETREVIDSNNLGGEQYYKVRITNNCPYAPTETDVYVRSTNYALYEWKNGREVMIIVAGPVGVGILNEDTVREITSEDLMTVPYGGPYESYTYEIREVNETSPDALASFVQGLGIIKIIDYSVGYAPVTKELQSIEPDHLCGDYGYPYPVGDENHDCIVNFKDLGVIAEHWLVCTKPEY
ncbi:MAG: hypothetical protein WBC22_13445 [Sedimentisphaerales bacterium]